MTGGPFLHQWKDVNELEAAVHDFYVKQLLNLRILQTILIWGTLDYPLVNSNSYWKLPFIVDLPIKHGDFS